MSTIFISGCHKEAIKKKKNRAILNSADVILKIVYFWKEKNVFTLLKIKDSYEHNPIAMIQKAAVTIYPALMKLGALNTA